MHTGPIADSAGTFAQERDVDRPCPKCGVRPVKMRVWESSCGGYEDEAYRCPACDHSWWIDGIDS